MTAGDSSLGASDVAVVVLFSLSGSVFGLLSFLFRLFGRLSPFGLAGDRVDGGKDSKGKPQQVPRGAGIGTYA